ncbi:MAG: 30S ribosomal protein S17 [Gammaproteobacteria bacterium]|nr:30S ribosomal protein S17 [Gammaproteobacteria bacterium]|tara:strand:+ start:5285 stop:5593 length:309 start_codon:yes stop_codon:yes gene_type:complete
MAESAAEAQSGQETGGAAERVTRTASGTVVSNRMDKTITVLVERRVQHPVYGKIIRRSSKLHAHDENNDCNVGDTVTVEECRPLSKTKTWMLKSIDERAREV